MKQISLFRDSLVKMKIDKGLGLQSCEKEILKITEEDGENEIQWQ